MGCFCKGICATSTDLELNMKLKWMMQESHIHITSAYPQCAGNFFHGLTECDAVICSRYKTPHFIQLFVTLYVMVKISPAKYEYKFDT